MTSHLQPIAMPAPNITDNGEEADTDSSSSYSSTSSTIYPQFAHFSSLPPELRHHIWRLAVPCPGINFFNVHCFPNDHAGCNRSASPPWAYLDLRRASIEDSDADVSRYDPSTWQARLAVRQSCREARDICTIPASKSAVITLTRPRRGLFVRAGDGQLRKTPLRAPASTVDANDIITEPIISPEPVVRRTVEVHADEILCLSVENCSFNLPHEERPSIPPDSDSDVDDFMTGDTEDEGWAYDPQLTPKLPLQIPASHLCANMARCSLAPLRLATDALFGLLYGHIPKYLELRSGELWPGRLLLMFDSHTQVIRGRTTHELVWDRFDGCYVRLPWQDEDFNPPHGFPVMYRLTKVASEDNGIRKRYLESGLLHSPKRPARTVGS